MDRTYNDTMFRDTFEHEYTWLNGFLRNVQRYGTRPAVIDPETHSQWTYRELNAQANAFARALLDCGIKKNDVVMIALRNCPVFAFAYAGARKAGAILLAANCGLAPGEMARLIDHNRPRIVIYSANIRSTAQEAQTLCSFKPQLFILADNIENESIPAGHCSYEEFTDGKPADEFPLNFRPHIYDEVIRLCTSGTTSLPKCVPVNDINEVLTAHDVIMHCALTSRDITLNMTPWFHRGGCHAAGPGAVFYAGGAAAVMRNFRPNHALEWISSYSVTFLIGAPASISMISKMQKKRRFDLSKLRGIIAMGAPLAKDDCIEYMQTLTPNIFNGYGTTETFWNSLLTPADLPENAGSAGVSSLDDEIRVVKLYDGKRAEPEETVPCDGTTEGEVIIKSPAKSTYAYFNGETSEAEKFYKGWMYTGDTATWNKDRFVTIKGRKDDMIIVSGENMYPAQIEEALNSHPKVKDSAVTSVPDKIRGQAVAAYIIPEENETLTVQEIASFCADSPLLSQYKRPRFFRFVTEIPMTATGKKKHSVLKQMALDDFRSGTLQKR